jgi:asparagine synthase (glutamine-hydrolysing)
MRLIGGLLRLDGGTASIDTLRAMAAAMTAPSLAPRMFHALDGPMGMFWLDFSASPLPSAPPEGWLIAADMRLNDLAGSTVRGCEADAHMQAVKAVEQAGPDFPDKLSGDFAVALWNRSERRLWLGRDAMGIRPLAYCHQPGNWFAFASLPKALHRTGLASCRPDPDALADFFMRTYFHDGDSGFSDIRYLKQGHSVSMTSKDCSSREHRAWRPDPGMVGSWRHGPEAAAEELRHLVTRAVSSCLPPNGPIGCELSGGLDSSSIAVLAAREMRNRQGHVIAISQIDDEHPAIVVDDDRHLMQAVLEQEPDIQWFGAPRGSTLAEFDEDLPNSVFGARWHVFHNVLVNAGADILLSGAGGDEGASFAGRGLYLELLRQGYWRRLSTELSE